MGATGRRAVLALAAGVLLAGCSSAPPTTFDLSVPPGATRQQGTQLAVAQPLAIQVLESDRIIVRSRGGTLSAVPGAQWADQLPRLVQTRLVQAFENTGRAVSRAASGVSAQAVLASEIRFFGVSTEDSPQAVVEISVKMVESLSGRIVSGRVFRAAVPMTEVSGASAAAALDQAAVQVFREIVRWSAGRG